MKDYNLSDEDKLLLENGKVLPVMEEFYSIQGEGLHTGKAAYFVRIGGCDVGCNWCDVKESWNPNHFPPTKVDEVLSRIYENISKTVLVTGGEPLNYNLDYFCKKLGEKSISRHIETSGSSELSGEWDWICLSPKKNKVPLNRIFTLANELKVIIESKEDFEWAMDNSKKVSDKCELFVQPEWSVASKIMSDVVEFVKSNPKWKVSIQSQKYMRVP